MKKNVIALMLVLPLLFVFTVFSSGNVASLGVSVSVNGVEILNSPQNDTLHVDLASYNGDFTLDVKVTPENASDKKVSFVVEEVPGSAFADVSVSEAGVVTAKSTGIARISAVTNDGGYRDSITVNVTSSKPYGMNVSLYGLNSDENLLTPTANGYTAQVTTGTYRYETSLYPEGYGVKAEVQSGFAVIDGNAGTLLLPFSVETVVDFYYDNGAFGVGKRADRKRRGKLHFGIGAGQHVLCLLRAGEAISRGQRKRIRTGFFRTAVAAKLLQSGRRAFSRRHRHRFGSGCGRQDGFCKRGICRICLFRAR